MTLALWVAACGTGRPLDEGVTPSIDIADYMSCALDPAQGFWCWGEPGYEVQLSDDTRTDNSPMYIPRNVDMLGFQIAVGASTVDALGAVNFWNQPGAFPVLESGGLRVDGEWVESAAGLHLWDDVLIRGVTAWAAMGRFVCFQQDEAAIICDHGTSSAPDPTDWDLHRSAGRRFVFLSVGDGGVCGVDDRGVVDCYGLPSAMDAGVPREEPALLQPRRRFHKVFTWQDGQGCALEPDGTPECWGNVPDFLIGPGWTDIAFKRGAVCAIRLDGEVACEGDRPFVPYPGVLPPE